MSAIEFLNDLAQKLQTQDNLCTASPNYTIQEKRLICGIDEDYGGSVGWFSEEARNPEEEGSRKHRALERYYDRYGKEPEGWTRCGYAFCWTYTGVNFLTYAGAQAYVDGQGRRRHENEIRVYVDSHYRNYEMKEVRRLLAGPVVEVLRAAKELADLYKYETESGVCVPTFSARQRLSAALSSLETAKEPHQ